jgi:LDH2 family malate/lactate/ureidoglycolate dehydrogenase
VTAERRRFAEEPLRAFGEAVLAGLGAGPAAAHTVVDSLIAADRRGVHTHGLVRLPSYCRNVRGGEVAVDAVPRIERARGPAAWVDGRRAFGAVTGTFGMDAAVERAGRHGVGLVVARGCNHFGAAAYYALRAVDRGFVGIAATNTPAVMTPWGGVEARLGNNPFCVAAPTGDARAPFVLDMAQSAVARGRIKLAELEGEAIPEDWALDAQGRPTTDPAAALEGALLPAGGYKGSGLALAIEILTGVLAGAGLSYELVNTSMTGRPSSSADASAGTVGNLFVALDPDCFAGREAFLDGIARLSAAVKATPPAPGVQEVLLPGELESRSAEQARRLGIALPESTVEALAALAGAEDIPFEAAAT